MILVAIFSIAAARLPLFQKDMRRSISLGISILGLLTVLLSTQVLVTGMRLRALAIEPAVEGLTGQWNGLILGSIVLLMVSSLVFFFAIGVFIWSFVPTAVRPSTPPGERVLGGLDNVPKNYNLAHQR